jgi:hypothetical protein
VTLTLVGGDDFPEDGISQEEADLLADAMWAADILGPDDFAELQTLGMRIIEGSK